MEESRERRREEEEKIVSEKERESVVQNEMGEREEEQMTGYVNSDQQKQIGRQKLGGIEGWAGGINRRNSARRKG